MDFLKQDTEHEHHPEKRLVENPPSDGRTVVIPQHIDIAKSGNEAWKPDKKYKLAKLTQILTYWPMYALLKFFVHLEIRGQENLNGLDGKAVIFASNHASFLDGPICAVSMLRRERELYPKRFFPIRFLVWHTYYSAKYLFVALYIWMTGSVKIITYGGNLQKTLSESIMLLNRGEKIWIYPEGKISPDGKLQQGKRGVAYLHEVTNVPIVPVGITGTFGVLSFRSVLRKNKVMVNIGRPVHSFDNPGTCSLEKGAEKVMNLIKDLIIEDI
ncbi:MAG: lysophospholipid acyltransferase family protein [Planctomycetota bacterium]|jgi:1-acyl-sn-glycerol-3-phosphate acyltransferase